MSVLPKNKKVTVGIGVAAAAAAAIALGGGTYAAFSDSETGPGGTLAAGTLDLEVGGKAAQATLLDTPGMVPGQAPVTKKITVKNTGSVAGNLSGTLAVTGADGTCTEPEKEAEGAKICAANGNLHEQIVVTVNGKSVPVTLGANQSFPIPPVKLEGEKDLELVFEFSLPEKPGNENNKVQGDTLKITSTLDLVQA